MKYQAQELRMKFAAKIFCTNFWSRIEIFSTYLLIVESGRESENSTLRVEREDVVGPVGDDGVGDLAVGAFVQIRC